MLVPVLERPGVADHRLLVPSHPIPSRPVLVTNAVLSDRVEESKEKHTSLPSSGCVILLAHLQWHLWWPWWARRPVARSAAPRTKVWGGWPVRSSPRKGNAGTACTALDTPRVPARPWPLLLVGGGFAAAPKYLGNPPRTCEVATSTPYSGAPTSRTAASTSSASSGESRPEQKASPARSHATARRRFLPSIHPIHPTWPFIYPPICSTKSPTATHPVIHPPHASPVRSKCSRSTAVILSPRRPSSSQPSVSPSSFSRSSCSSALPLSIPPLPSPSSFDPLPRPSRTSASASALSPPSARLSDNRPPTVPRASVPLALPHASPRRCPRLPLSRLSRLLLLRQCTWIRRSAATLTACRLMRLRIPRPMLPPRPSLPPSDAVPLPSRRTAAASVGCARSSAPAIPATGPAPTAFASIWPAASSLPSRTTSLRVRLPPPPHHHLLPFSMPIPCLSHTEAGTLRRRAQRACRECHSHKTKCSGDLPRCKRCELSNLSCEYTPAKRRFASLRTQQSARSSAANSPTARNPDGALSPTLSSGSGSGSGSTGIGNGAGTAPGGEAGLGNGNAFALLMDTAAISAEALMARKDFIWRHLDAYMRNMYWLPSQGFVHPEITHQQIEDGSLSPAYAAGICAVASFFVNPTEAGREFGQRCSDHIEMTLFQSVQRFSQHLLPLFAFNITFNFLKGSIEKVWQCFGCASRLILGLRINWDQSPPEGNFAQQEAIRRIVWHFFHLDRVLADGYEEYISCRAENMRIPLPCDEAAFRENRPVVAEMLYDKPTLPPNSTSLHASLIRLVDLRHRIQVTTKRLCSASAQNLLHVDGSKIMADINGLQNELTRFHSSLPIDIRLSDQSVSRYMASMKRPAYVYLHCHLAGSHIDLYRYFLPGQQERIPDEIIRKLPQAFVSRSQKQAIAHSMSFARFCGAVQDEVDQMKGTGRIELAGDYSTIQLATNCIRVLVLTLKYKLYHDITEDTTAPLWRVTTVDEPHIRSLIRSVQRLTEPWCGILKMAQHAFAQSKALVAELDKADKVDDRQRHGEKMFPPLRATGDGRFPGPELLLGNPAGSAGAVENPLRHSALDTQGADQWLRSATMLTGRTPSFSNSQLGSVAIEAGTPGIPILLAQARKAAALDQSVVAGMFDANNTVFGLASVLPDGNLLSPPNDIPMTMQVNGSIDPAMYQQEAGPSSGFLIPEPGPYLGGFADQYSNASGQATNFGPQSSYG
ncbi:hypothetical protein DCS_01287 [Drechmeria coniospora]|uniref:Zn(2)-C6 fungal-type domain-containing protein n=1 Tax=Drechmeria coniospora TaxID=98403 RepID=A0A151GT21_DRECN|nr:hypothetical protein DCS_01287 [Drechmeria coniospora]KYK60152.1 hypothetical protein DCS_01287 [Drechmeria coniospora]